MLDPELAALNGWAQEPETAPGLDLDELVDALKREADAADSEWERLRQYQDLARDYYEARPFGNEVDGRSQIVLPDVQETIDYMVPLVLRVFVSGEKVVEFEAEDEADVELVDEASNAVSYHFMRKQDGYRVLHDWLMSGLSEKYGVAKTTVIDEEKVTRNRIIISDPVELESIQGEIEETQENPDGSYSLTIKGGKKSKRFVDETVPAEEFRYSARARHEDSADYLAHCPVKTRSELVDMGFDREQVYALPTYSRLPDGRNHNRYDPDPESTPALQQVRLWEEYARIDLDGDGIAERVQVFRVDNEILRWADGKLAIETVEEQPFSVFCPFPRPNRLIGYSLAEKVMDVQLGRSTIARQLFDGMYQANMPRPIVETNGMDENTIDDLLSPIAGAPIRVSRAESVQAFQTNFDVGKSLSVMEWFSREREARSGTARSSQTLDPNTLNNQTATEYSGDREDGQTRQEFVTRNFAEAFVRLLLKKYRLMRAEGVKFKAKINGAYKEVDPSLWPEELDFETKVGLGRGSKDKRVQGRMMLAPFLAEGAQTGKVSDKKLFHAIDGLVRDLGLGRGSDFWDDPDAPPEIDPATGQPKEEPQQSDPEAMAAQAEAQREQQKLELEKQKTAATLQLQQENNAATVNAMREKHAMEMQQRREAADLDAQLKQQAAERDYALEMYKADKQAELAVYQANLQAETSRHVASNRPGGDLDK
jgi:hypothetical protein